MEADTNVKTTISLGKTEIEWEVCIAPIRDDVLIGMDLLKEVDRIILARQGDLIIKDELIPGRYCKESNYHVARVTVAAETVLEPMTETNVVGKLDYPNENVFGVLDPASLKNGSHTGSVLVQMKENIPVRVMNPTYQKISLHPGTPLGKLVEAENLVDEEQEEQLVDDSVVNHEVPLSLPDHLRPIVDSVGDSLTSHQKQEVCRTISDYRDIFATNDEDLGCFSGIQHHIKTGEAKPIRQPMRHTPLGFQGEKKDHLDKLLRNGTVVSSQSEWAAPVVLVRKKDNGIRWCIDYRKINTITSKDSYPLPNIEECLDTLAGSSLFSTLDLQSGYHQIEVAPEDQCKTAFITRYGLFEYTRMPFGLCGAPGTFQQAMELVLRGLQWEMVLIYLDDVIIASSNFQAHITHLT